VRLSVATNFDPLLVEALNPSSPPQNAAAALASLRQMKGDEANGAIVAAKLRRVEALLVTVRGGADNVVPVYGATGQRQLPARGLALGRA